ncbi:MAG TPA: YbaB/EbfC family nucleoid-associated protein [Fibrobacteria bacterium]|jgi:DNA-binding YbaB/EbfC family protein|nr:YbaB/EbfC family nucleoid-associated protein [Fibrobacteria bacterium]
MNMQKMMKDLQKMQGRMNQIQESLQATVYEAEAGGGLVKVSLNGKFEVQAVRLKKEAVDPDDIEALEDLLLAAFNEARAKAEADSQSRMGGLTKGLGLPGM